MNVIDHRFLTAAIVAISAALVFYSIGVWGERLQKQLKGWHVAFFLLGLACDFTGTSMMAELVKLTGKHNTLHMVTGTIAVALMLVHAVWAVVTYRRGSPRAKHNFNRFSIVVWAIWLIPYLIGVYIGAALHQ